MFHLDRSERNELRERLIKRIEKYIETAPELRVAPSLLLTALRSQFPEFIEKGAQSITGKPVFYLKEVVHRVVSSGKAWISTAVLGTGVTAIRACITNFRTQPEDIRVLVATLRDSRRESA